MVLCLLALPVFAVLGIFSVKYRNLAKQSILCAFKKIALRPCDVGLDTYIKSSIVAPFLKRNKRVGRFVHKHFTVLTWIFLILMIWSTIQVAVGGYNFYMYGHCDGPQGSGFCVFDPTGSSSATSTPQVCTLPIHNQEKVGMDALNTSLLFHKPGSGKTVIFIGCYTCKYTIEMIQTFHALIEQYDSNVYIGHLPIHEGGQDAVMYDYCMYQQNLFWPFHIAVFSEGSHDMHMYASVAQQVGADMQTLQGCLEDAHVFVQEHVGMFEAMDIFGTPTVIIDDTILVGPKPRRVYERLMR
ncbi:MAG: DsbA family protein [Candidatus Woesearchaeota archaeon]